MSSVSSVSEAAPSPTDLPAAGGDTDTDTEAAGQTAISPSRPLRVLALAKQIPVVEDMQLGSDGRLVREGLDLHMNDYCRRGVSKGLEIAQASGGTLSVLTLGPPSAETVCREAIAFGADRGFHVSDPAFAGSDTLATAKAVGAAVRLLGPFDLILCGRNSVDADTGQVPPQLAQILDLPFACGVRELSLVDEHLSLLLEHDDEWVNVEMELPCVLSCAERLCDPCKIKDPVVWAGVDAERIEHLSAADLGDGPWGTAASPTWVGEVRSVQVDRRREVLRGSLSEQVDRAVAVLTERGALGGASPSAEDSASAGEALGGNSEGGASAAGQSTATDHAEGALGGASETQASEGARRSDDADDATPPSAAAHLEDPKAPVVAVLAEPGRERGTKELLGAAAELASALGGRVTVLGEPSALEEDLGRWGADAAVRIVSSGNPSEAHSRQTHSRRSQNVRNVSSGTPSEAHSAEETSTPLIADSGAPLTADAPAPPARLPEEDVARAALEWAEAAQPWAILALGTVWGREVASRLAAELGAGLTGDAVGLRCVDGRLLADKPAFGGRLVAAIGCTSDVQMATVRPGVFQLPQPRQSVKPPVFEIEATPRGRVRVTERRRDDDSSLLTRAQVVIGVGKGVDTADYALLNSAASRIGAELCATRKVTDVAAMPRARQVGITGHTIAPRLYIAVGISGRFNHTVGVRSSGSIVAVNTDPDAEIFDWCDLGFVGDWRDVFEALIPRLEKQ